MSKIWRKKTILDFEKDINESELKRILGKWSLTAVGVGAIIGGGIFVLVGTGAYYHAGPALSLSFLIAGIACMCAALCYSEFASILPVPGSTYSYAYATVGELFAWIIGWSLVLEYAMGSMTVAVSWSGYFNKMLHIFGIYLPEYLTSDPISYRGEGFSINLPAFIFVALVTILLIKGAKGAAKTNNLVVLVKVFAVLFVIFAGLFFVNIENWIPFIPDVSAVREGDTMRNAYGLSGVISGASAIFFAYVGSDSISTQAGEAINPRKDIPFAIISSLSICTILYIVVSLVLTGMMNYENFDPEGKYPEAIKAPVAYAFEIAGQNWAGNMITIAATIGLTSVLITLMTGQSRIFLAMGKDRLIPKFFADIHNKRKTPHKNIAFIGIFVALIAALIPMNKLAEMTSFGTIFAFTMVCISVWILRRKHPNLKRSFKVPLLPLTATLGISMNVYLICNLSNEAKLISAIWMALGIIFYFCYSQKRSLLHQEIKPEKNLKISKK